MDDSARKTVVELLRRGSRELLRAGSVRVPTKAFEKAGALGSAIQSRLVFEWRSEEVAQGKNAALQEMRRFVLQQLGGEVKAAGAPRGDAEFNTSRVQLPTALPPGRPLPVSIEGRLVSRRALQSVELMMDGMGLPTQPLLSPATLNDQGFREREVLLSGALGVFAPGIEHRLGLRFTLVGGEQHLWEHPFTFERAEVPCAVRRVAVGPYDKDSGRTRVILDVDIYDAQPGDTVAVEVSGAVVAERRVAIEGDPGTGSPKRGTAAFEDWVRGLVPGTHPCSVTYRTAGHSSVLWTGECHVRPREPEIHVERLSVSPVVGGDPSTCRIYVHGWVENDFLVDCLIFDVDGMRAAVFGLDHLRPDIPRGVGSPLISRQGFEAEFDVSGLRAGHHEATIIATQRGGETGRTSQSITFAPAATPELEITSEDLERLVRKQGLNLYSAIEIRGALQTAYDEVTALLDVDGRTVSEQRFAGPGRHVLSLRHAPSESRDHEVRLIVSGRGKVLFASNPAKVRFNKVSYPDDAAAALGTLVDRFELRAKIAERVTNQELLARLAERQPERVPDLIERIRKVGRAIQNERNRGPIEPRKQAPDRRLKVLVAAWETPGPGHGGGVLLMESLKRLGERHDVTLVHTHGIDEVGHVDALKPHVSRIVSVQRLHLPGAYRNGLAFPLHNYENFIAELRKVIELELMSHQYDLVNYEYAEMGLYVVPGIPSVLTIHEVGHTAIASSAFRTVRPIDDAIGDLDNFVRNFHYATHDLPSLCPDLITLTQEDALAISPFSPNGRIYSNPGGVSIDAPRPPSARAGSPAIAYVGNYQHPPNVDAALFLAQRVMPELRARFPDLTLHLYGPAAPPRIQSLDGQDGIVVEGFVEDLREHLRQSTALVAPIFTGAGQRVKILDAFGAGAVVIATDLAMRGVALKDGEHYYRANSPEEFVNCLVHVINQPEQAARVAHTGQARAAEAHGWPASIERREAIWMAAMEKSAR